VLERSSSLRRLERGGRCGADLRGRDAAQPTSCWVLLQVRLVWRREGRSRKSEVRGCLCDAFRDDAPDGTNSAGYASSQEIWSRVVDNDREGVLIPARRGRATA